MLCLRFAFGHLLFGVGDLQAQLLALLAVAMQLRVQAVPVVEQSLAFSLAQLGLQFAVEQGAFGLLAHRLALAV
ncbi:hypothetical protein HRbin14_02190 [bacterium HR14]|nr:hypothetical protein HRbin14_02190 [bacterium HR14]